MWDCLVKLSTWAEGNSGQIQIVIGLVALGLAILGYRRVLQQITITQEQEQVANEQRGLDLKIQSLSLTLTALDRNNAKINSLQEVLKLSEEALNSLHADSEVKEEDIRKIIQTIIESIEGAESLREDIFSLCNTINDQETLHRSDILKSIYELLISITNDHNLSDSMRHHFVYTEQGNRD